MDQKLLLKQVVSELYQVPPDTIRPDFILEHRRFQGSAGRGILAAAIRRRIGVYCAKAFSVKTYAELEGAVCGASLPASPAPANENGRGAALEQPQTPDGPAPTISTISAGMHIGVDIEMVENMPEAADFWTSDFYRAHFSDAEIAYCVRQNEPRVHFAARWCAKEALAKCDQRYVGVDPVSLQVVIQANGQPIFEGVLEGRAERLPFALSLTHTPLLAAAVVAALASSSLPSR